MSTVVGIVSAHTATVFLGADTRGVLNGSTPVERSKIATWGTVVVAYSGQTLDWMLVRREIPAPDFTADVDSEAILFDRLSMPIYELLRSHDRLTPTNKPGLMQTDFLLALPSGVLAQILNDGSVRVIRRGCYAVGSGGDFALGYLDSIARGFYHATSDAPRYIGRAIEVASRFDIFTSPESEVYRVDKSGVHFCEPEETA